MRGKLYGICGAVLQAMPWCRIDPSRERTVCAGSIPSLGDNDKDLQVNKPLTATDTSDETYSSGRTSRCSMLLHSSTFAICSVR